MEAVEHVIISCLRYETERLILKNGLEHEGIELMDNKSSLTNGKLVLQHFLTFVQSSRLISSLSEHYSKETVGGDNSPAGSSSPLKKEEGREKEEEEKGEEEEVSIRGAVFFRRP